MGNLFGDLSTETQPPYFAIYQSLQQVRAAFHREGRISDANAKLDKTVKLLALHFGYLKGLVSDADYTILSDRKNFKVSHLNRVFAQMAREPVFHRRGIGSIFGDNPATIFREGDEGIAFDLLMVARHAFGAQKDGKAEIDILNEAFGHHVRDNFRNHTEDAQYMTPPEIVNFMVGMGIEMIRVPGSSWCDVRSCRSILWRGLLLDQVAHDICAEIWQGTFAYAKVRGPGQGRPNGPSICGELHVFGEPWRRRVSGQYHLRWVADQ